MRCCHFSIVKLINEGVSLIQMSKLNRKVLSPWWTLLKKRLWHRCFPVNFAKFLRTPFFYRTPLVAAFAIIWLFFEFWEHFSLLRFFSKAGFKRWLIRRKPFKDNFIKWKAKQSWKENVWKYLFILPIFFTWGRN